MVDVNSIQGYGSTEAGGISRMISQEECNHIGSAGRVTENVEVKIVDHVTGKPLPAGQQGELWVRGPAVMTGDHNTQHEPQDYYYYCAIGI